MKTKKFILTTAMIWLCTLCASAYDFSANGLYYNFISGTDSVEVTSPDEYPNPYEGDLVIPSTVSWEGKDYSVTAIGDYAFDGAGITSCQIPNSITRIGFWAFAWTNLVDITIPASVATIEENAFWGTEKLTAFRTTNDNPAFAASAGILYNKEKTALLLYPAGKTETTFSIPGSVTVIGASAFGRCTHLTSISIPDGVTTIGDGAFEYCENLSSIELPNSVTSIEEYAFSYCTQLNSITLPNSIERINFCTFCGCENLTTLTIPNSVTSIDYGAFEDCSSLTTITIPNSVVYISSSAFEGCSSLASVSLPNSLKSIESYTFYGCSNLTSVTIPANVTSIGSGAFYGCKIESVKIPNSVTFISGNAFYCDSFTAVLVNDDNPNYIADDGVLYSKDKTSLIIYPIGKSATSFSIPHSVKTIGEYVFAGNTKLTTIVLPEGLETIGQYAFNSCRFTSIVFPNTLKEIGYASFELTYIKNLIIPASVETIDSWAFTKCPYLENIVFEGPVKNMGGVVFAGYACCPRPYTIEVKSEPFKIDNSLGYVDVENSTLIVPDGMKDLFLAEAGWKDFGTILEKSKVATGISVEEVDPIVYISGNRLYIDTPQNEMIQIYSVTGKLLNEISKPAGKMNFSLSSFHESLLIVKGSSGWVKKVMQNR